LFAKKILVCKKHCSILCHNGILVAKFHGTVVDLRLFQYVSMVAGFSKLAAPSENHKETSDGGIHEATNTFARSGGGQHYRELEIIGAEDEYGYYVI